MELQNALSVAERERDEALNAAAKLANKLIRYHRFQTSFGGITMAQYWCDLTLWEAVLNENPVDAVFEIGTWNGGFSWWLYAQSLARDMYFQTYDAIVPERSIPAFYKVDVFAETKMLGQRFRAFEPCVVFCDGGNKPRELQTFSRELRDPKSLIMVHDWGTEMLPEDVPEGIEMVYRDLCEEIGSITRVFRLEEGYA